MRLRTALLLAVAAAGCQGATSVLLTVDAPGRTLSSLEVRATLAGADGGADAMHGKPIALPGTVYIELPGDVATTVAISVTAVATDGSTLTGTTVVQTQAHHQVLASVTLGGPVSLTWTARTNGAGNTDLFAVWGTSDGGSVFAVGRGGTILHWAGASWEKQPTPNGTNDLLGVWGSGAGNVFAVGKNGTIVHYDGAAWSTLNSGTTADLKGVWGSSATDVYAVGDSAAIRHLRGAPNSAWVREDLALDAGVKSFVYNAVWGSGPSAVYIAGNYPAGMVHSPGSSSWNVEFMNGYQRGVWGSSGTNIWSVGDYRYLSHGMADWSGKGRPAMPLYGVWGSAANDVVAVGLAGTIEHFDGTAWTAQTVGANDLNGVWGSSSSDVYAVGTNGTILHRP